MSDTGPWPRSNLTPDQTELVEVATCSPLTSHIPLSSRPPVSIPSIHGGLDEVSVEGDVDVYIITVDGVLALPFVQTHPHLVVELQIQHQTLALHDGPVAGLRVHDGPLPLILHDVQVRLLEVPRVDVDIEKVDPGDEAVELSLEHVEVLMQIDEDRVEDQGLVVFQAVEGLASAHGEGRVLGLAGVPSGSHLALGTNWAHGAL